MSTFVESPVGSTFVDANGLTRIKTRFGFNGFVSEADALRSGTLTLRPRATVYVWRLADGHYDWTAIERPRSRHFADAERVLPRVE